MEDVINDRGHDDSARRLYGRGLRKDIYTHPILFSHLVKNQIDHRT